MNDRFVPTIRAQLERQGVDAIAREDLVSALRNPDYRCGTMDQPDGVDVMLVEYIPATLFGSRGIRLEFSNGVSGLVFFRPLAGARKAQHELQDQQASAA